MKFNFLLKSTTLALLSSVVSAKVDSKGDCKEILDFFTERNVASSLPECLVDSNGKVTSIELNSYYITEECVQKALSYNTITKLTYTKVGATPSHNPEYTQFPPEIVKLTNLEEFIFSFSGFSSNSKTSLADGDLRLSKTLKKLAVSGIVAQPRNIFDIAYLTNLEELHLTYFNRPAEPLNFEPLKALTKLTAITLNNEGYIPLNDFPEAVYSSSKTIRSITIHGHSLNNISSKISNLTNLVKLDLKYNYIESIFGKLSNNKNLEYLDVSNNSIDEELPEFLNNFKNLKYLDVSGNPNITGKTLTNASLETCKYDKNYKSICIASDIKCLSSNNYSYEKCEEDIPETTDGRCGEGFGKCKNSQCCSKFGWCGTSDLHCTVAEGCQTKYGKCSSI